MKATLHYSRFLATALFTLAALSGSQAKADSIVTFDLAGKFADGTSSAGGTDLNGFVQINTTIGTLLSLDIKAPAYSAEFNQVFQTSVTGGAIRLIIVSTSQPDPNVANFQFYFSVTTLVGYNGGDIPSLSEPFNLMFASNFSSPQGSPFVQFATLSPEVPNTAAEPTTIALLAPGMCLIGFGLWRRSRFSIARLA